MEQIRDNQKRISSLAGSERCTARAHGDLWKLRCERRAVRGEHPSSLVIFLRALKYAVLGNRENFVYADPVNYTPCPLFDICLSLSPPPPYHNPLPSSVAQLARKYADGSARLARLVIRLRGPPGLRLRPEVNGTAMEMGTKMDHQRASDVETPCNLISRPPRHSAKPWRKGGRLNWIARRRWTPSTILIIAYPRGEGVGWFIADLEAVLD